VSDAASQLTEVEPPSSAVGSDVITSCGVAPKSLTLSPRNKGDTAAGPRFVWRFPVAFPARRTSQAMGLKKDNAVFNYSLSTNFCKIQKKLKNKMFI